ncbi:MAG: hypothetical protein HOQ14_08740 [Gemmatimonadaceae bacterium]|nr:hypothetical protein [Gemmatimonadaceae bacterium]
MRSLSVSPAHARWPARVPLGALLLFGLACAPRVTAPPAPARRGPTEAERAAARADSARARARQDSVREVAARAAAAAAR